MRLLTVACGFGAYRVSMAAQTVVLPLGDTIRYVCYLRVKAAIVIHDLASTNPGRPRAIEVRGRAEAIADPQPMIRIYPERIVSWASTPNRSASGTPAP